MTGAAATHRARAKASRQPYRRGGLVLGTSWSEFEAGQLVAAQLLALLLDPVVSVQIEIEDEAGVRWTSPTFEERLALAGFLKGGDAPAAEPSAEPRQTVAEIAQAAAQVISAAPAEPVSPPPAAAPKPKPKPKPKPAKASDAPKTAGA